MCQLLEKARENKGNISYYQIAKELNISMQVMNNWKNDKSKPNGLHTLKLAEMAGVELKEAIKIVESGFINLSLLIVTSILMSLIYLTKYIDLATLYTLCEVICIMSRNSNQNL